VAGITVAYGGATTSDGVLVQEAAAGSGVSYGALYDRYATQVFNYCLRLTGSPDDAADATQEAFVNVLRRLQDDDRPVLDFSSYLFAAARHESYALMRQRARVRPSDSPPEERGRVANVEIDPERAALLHDDQEAVRKANALLAPRHREVLALREVAGRSYDEVGEIMGISGNAAAQLIFRARSKLREALTAGAVASVVATSEECESAQLLLNRIQDGEPVEAVDRQWLEEHLEECGSCQTANRMLLEAGASYRLWMPVALFAGMRADTLTRAGELIGADWSQVAAPGHGAAGTSAGSSTGGGVATGGGGSTGGGVAAAASAVIVAAGIAFLALTGDDERGKAASSNERPAAEAPRVAAKAAPTRADKANSASAATTLVAARAPFSERAPDGAKPSAQELERSDGRAAPPQEPFVPPEQPNRPEGQPAPPPLDGSGPGAPGPPPPKAEPSPPPAPPADPVPAAPPLPVDPAPTDPARPPPTGCTWPGRGGGPAGCPPGHGGIPPGHGGTPPGRGP
jgi:RNA polymerase sigma factor (sigma-70 family)